IESTFNLNTESTSLVDVPVTAIAELPLLSVTITPPPPTPLITHLQQTPTPTPFNQTNQFVVAVSSIPGIVDAYLANKMHEAVKTAVQLQSERLEDEAQAENADFINKLDDNIKKIIKNQVKEQVKAQVSKILSKIEKTVNEQLKAKVLTRSSNESKKSHVVATILSELELKKILIDNIESNKSIHRFDEQKNLYKALVDAYESDKLILDTYGDTVLFKRRRDDEDKDEEPSDGSNWGSKRRRAGKEPESTSAPKEKTSKTTGKSTEGTRTSGVTKDQPNEETSQLPDWFQKPAKPPTPDHDWKKSLLEAHGPVQPWLSSLAQMEDPLGPTFELMKGSCKSLVELEYFLEEVYKATTDQLDWINPEGQQYPHDLRKLLPLIPNSRGPQVIPFDHFINNDLEYLSGGVSSRKYTTSVMKTKAADYGHIKWIEDLHLDWITVRRDDDKLYKFKEGDFNMLRIQDIKDMLLLLVQGKLTNLTVEKRLAFNLPKEAQPHKARYVQNRLMRIDELHKFSDGTLNDVWTALDDRLKGIWIKYLPQNIWRQSDRDKAGAMIQAIDKQLKTRRIIRSLEKFVGGRPSILTDSMVTPTEHGRMTKPYSSPRFTANCFNAGYLKMEVKDEKEVTQVKVLMAIVDDELTVRKSHARSREWVDITIRKVNTLLSMDEDADWQNYLKMVQNQRLVERLNPDSKLQNFNTGRILVLENQAVNESLETSNTPESSKDSEAEFLTPLPP
ncbi:hypothetical protein Tco_0605978, partial [Tanacetum coccineum]